MNTKVNSGAKRVVDIVSSLAGLLIFSPVFAIIAFAIKLDSNGPVFYHAVRVGRFNKPFHMYKFRTMIVDADKVGPGLTIANDGRVTRAGRFLRKTKLDELPQLINVLNGSMSLVGPRPEDPRYAALYTDEQNQLLELRPGITSLAAVLYRHEENLLVGDEWELRYIHTVMPAKLKIELEYRAHMSLWQDLKIIARTFIVLFR